MKLLISILAALGLIVTAHIAQAAQKTVPPNCTASTFKATLNCAPNGDYIKNVATLHFNGSQFVGSNTDGSSSFSGTVFDCSKMADAGAQATGMMALAVVMNNPSENKIVELLPLRKTGTYLVALANPDNRPGLSRFSNETMLICSQK